MKYTEINELKVNKKLSKYDKYLKSQEKAIELHSLENGQIFIPIFVWQEKDEIIYGQTIFEIAQKHPDLGITVISVPFKDWQEAETWVIEHILSQPSITLWEKLELATTCENYWMLKAEAKNAQGARTDLDSEPETKSDSKKVNSIIASKVGCSPTMVHYFKKIRQSGKNGVIQKCMKGEMAISTAYENHIKDKDKGKTKPEEKPKQEVNVISSNFFENLQQDVNFGNKSMSKIEAPDPKPVVDKIVKAKLAKGKLWVSFNKKTGAMQIFRKVIDDEKGIINVKVDSLGCKIKEEHDETIIFEASYLNCGTEPYKRKDESDFEEAAA